MAKALNKNRKLYTAIYLIFALVILLFTETHIQMGEPLFWLVNSLGLIFIFIAIVGRIYATIFLGGYKNKTLIDYDIYSATRNPLYLFSFIGAIGVALFSMNYWIMIATPLVFLLIYIPLIKREERFLQSEFGDDYKTYLQNTPLFLPKRITKPIPKGEFVEASPHLIKAAVGHSLLWLGLYFIFIIINMLYSFDILPLIIL